MFEIPCDKCNSELLLDHQKTKDDYVKTMNYLVDTKGEIDPSTIQPYAYYICLRCNSYYKLTIEEVAYKIKYSIAKLAMDIRQTEEFKRLSSFDLGEETTSIYCGKCKGSFNNGYCLMSIYKVCSIRNKDEI